jgi:hypothetical protein
MSRSSSLKFAKITQNHFSRRRAADLEELTLFPVNSCESEPGRILRPALEQKNYSTENGLETL